MRRDESSERRCVEGLGGVPCQLAEVLEKVLEVLLVVVRVADLEADSLFLLVNQLFHQNTRRCKGSDAVAAKEVGKSEMSLKRNCWCLVTSTSSLLAL